MNPHPTPPAFDPEALLRRMSLVEKIGQMTQLDLLTVTVTGSSPIQLHEARLREALVDHGVGSFINNGLGRALSLDEWRYVHATIHELGRTETPNRIPVVHGIDSIHGATFVQEATLFPQNLALAAARDPELVQRVAEIAAAETRAAGLRWNFAPVLDVGRQPLWSRLPETYGEDPVLVSRCGVAAVLGFQGAAVGGPDRVAACMKHFLGYSFPFSGKDRSPALMSESHLREYFLPPFRAAVRAGVKTVMLNSAEVNGVPVHASRELVTDLLRGELGFDGVIVSDWEDVIRLHTWHRVAETPAEAVRLALAAGLDISMVPLDFSFCQLLRQLVRDGIVPESRIDESVRRILRLKVELGLFESGGVEPGAVDQIGRPEHRQAAVAAAAECLTLLKNEDSFLPLAGSQRVLVTGPAATSISALHGCWSFTWQGNDERWYPKDTMSIAEALRQRIGEPNLAVHRGVDFAGNDLDSEAAQVAARAAEVIILCLGEDAYAETPGDLNDLNLPEGQQAFAQRLLATGKPVVLVLVEGRGRIIRELEPGASAILLAYWPGSGGAQAIVDCLYGDTNPSGKLPFTYARHVNNLLTYDRKFTDGIEELSASHGIKVQPAKPQWEFGHGLSYTRFAFTNLKLAAPILRSGETLALNVEVTNIGARSGKVAVELYTRDLYASLAPPGRSLRAFNKIALAAGETQTVHFKLTAADLAFVNQQGELVTEPGGFEIMIGDLVAGFRYEP